MCIPDIARWQFFPVFASLSGTATHPRKNAFSMMFWVLVFYTLLQQIINYSFELLSLIHGCIVISVMFLLTSSNVCPSSSGAWACCCPSNNFMYYWWNAGVWYEQSSICFFHFLSVPKQWGSEVPWQISSLPSLVFFNVVPINFHFPLQAWFPFILLNIVNFFEGTFDMFCK